jgi:hypothetical protein
VNDKVDHLSAELRDELADSDRRRIVDPRRVPVRFSRLKRMAQSALHYWQSCQYDDDDTLARRIGRGVHAILFSQPLVVWPKRRQGKAWEEFEATNSGKEILNASEHAQALATATSIRRHPVASRLLFNGTVLERTISWTIQGRACSGTPDAVGAKHLADLKTARTTEPDRFTRQATWMSYHAQLAWYQDALEIAGMGRPEECYIIAVESAAPYAVTVLRLTERALDQGRRLNRLWWERLMVCEASNAWPAYVSSVVDFDVPDAEEFRLMIDGEETEIE